MFVFLPDETFHHSFYFVGVDRYGWLGIARVVGVVGVDVAKALHVLGIVRIRWSCLSARPLTST